MPRRGSRIDDGLVPVHGNLVFEVCPYRPGKHDSFDVSSTCGELGDALARVLERLEEPTEIESEHPRTGEPVKVPPREKRCL